MANTTTETGIKRSYRPSLIDRFNNWVEKLPIHPRIFNVVFGFALILIQLLFLQFYNGLKAEELLPVVIFNGLATPFLLALIHLLDHQAVTALSSMRSTLKLTEPELEGYQYLLSNMPSRQALIAGLAILIFAILSERQGIAPISYAALNQLPIFAIVFHIIDKSSAFLYGSFFYHTIRQLRLVNTLNSKHVRIDLFNLKPLQAFSRLTASTAVGLLVGVYGWILINPELLTNPITIVFSGLITIIAVAVFIWPLLGIHRLIEKEKERVLQDLDLRFKAAFSQINEQFPDYDSPGIERLIGAISSMEIQHKKIKATPTWPWSPETARFLITAIATPLILMIIQIFVLHGLER